MSIASVSAGPPLNAHAPHQIKPTPSQRDRDGDHDNNAGESPKVGPADATKGGQIINIKV